MWFLAFVGCAGTVAGVSVDALLAADGLSPGSVDALSGVPVGPGSAVCVRGDVWDWGAVVGRVARGEVVVFEPEDGSWRVGELVDGPLRAASMSSVSGLRHVVVVGADLMPARSSDRFLKAMEESGAVFWLCVSGQGSLPATVAGRCVDTVDVQVVSGDEAVGLLSSVSGCDAGDAARALSLVRGRLELAARVVGEGLWEPAELVSGTRVFRCGDVRVCRDFVSAFCELVSGRVVRDGARFSSLPPSTKRLVRVELARWFGSVPVVSSSVADAFVSRDYETAAREFRALVRANVDPVDALSVLAFA